MQKIKTAEDFKKQAELHGITQAFMRPCSICGYETGYIFRDGMVVFDAGCDCVTGGYRVYERKWDHIAEHYNMQRNPDYIKEMDEYWKFI